jgi:hypothetical protein
MLTLTDTRVTPETPLVPRICVLRFLFGQARLGSCWLNVLELDAPPPQLSCDLQAYAVKWRELPRSVQAIHIPWQPYVSRPETVRFGSYGIRYVPVVEERAWVDLRGSKSDYMSIFTAKQRYNLNRTVKKFADRFGLGEVKWSVCQEPDAMRKWFDVALKIAQRTWQARIGSGLQALDLERDRWIAESEEGRLRGYLLFAGEKPVAYALCSLYRKHVVYQVVGYDPEYRAWSPGTILLLKIIEDLFSQGTWDVLDLGNCADHLQYKKHFATGSQYFGRVFYFRPRSLFFPVLPHLVLSKTYCKCRAVGLTLGLRPAVHALQRIFRGKNSWSAVE